MFVKTILAVAFASTLVAAEGAYYGAPAPVASDKAPVDVKPAYGTPSDKAPVVEKPAYTGAPVSEKAPVDVKPAYGVPSDKAPVVEKPAYTGAPVSDKAPVDVKPAYGVPSDKAPVAPTPTYGAVSTKAPVITTPAYYAPPPLSSTRAALATTPAYTPECEGEPVSTKAAIPTGTPTPYLPVQSTRAPVATNIVYSGAGSIKASAFVVAAAGVAALFL
ncbi:hypothetical protein HDU97_003756 [Phlyctochytrium planicorne]|nr:hypothetical protein HDU97_003756 [Phlyctochytrium planicorne]